MAGPGTAGYHRLGAKQTWRISVGAADVGFVSVSDNSKITLDPILDGYYVGDIVVEELPLFIDGVARASVIGNRVVSGGLLTQAQLTTITMMSAQVAASAGGVARNLSIAEGVAPYLQPQLDER